MSKTIRKIKQFSALLLAAAVSLQGIGGGAASSLHMRAADVFKLTAYADSRAASVNTDRLNVRSGPGTSYGKIATLTAGTAVTVTGETKGADGYTWYSISFGGGSGYARHDLIAVNTVYAAGDADFENSLNVQGFPESYKNGLRGLHQKYPNWVFTALQTGLDWNTAVSEESKIGRNLVGTSSISSWKSIQAGAFDWAGNYWPGFDGASWVQASTELIAYYMDPRNFLSDPYIFQFELQKYDPSVQTRAGLETLVAGTFLAGDAVVPVEGSVIEGGTIIEGSTYSAAGGSSSSASSGVIGPGSTVSSGVSVIGPGGTYTVSAGSTAGPGGVTYTSGSLQDTADESSGTADASGTKKDAESRIEIGITPGAVSKQSKDILLSVKDTVFSSGSKAIAAAEELTGVIRAYANWQRDAQNKWVYYEKSTGTFLNDGWHWLDGNGDGIAECYYFYADGSLAVSDTVEGYYVNADGQWIHTNGDVITKNVGTESAGGSASGSTGSNASGSAAGSTGVSIAASGDVVISSAGPGEIIADSAAGQSFVSSAAAGSGPVVVSDSVSVSGMGGTTVTPVGADGSVMQTGGQLKKVPYVDIIMKAAETSGVSPYVLASAILQEQGKGTSDLVNGNSGYYNFYNIDAYEHDGMSAVAAGLSYAAQSGTGDRPWNTVEKAIIGGAKLYNANYVSNGQDTFYLKKFNVQGSNKYNHQFMTHVLAAASEGSKVSAAYTDAFKAQALEFKIPVYQNMPESTQLPTGDGNPNNKLSALSVEGYTLTPTFNMDTESYSLIVDGASAQVYINASTIDAGAKVEGAGYVTLNVGGNEVNVKVTAQNGSERIYRLSITRKENTDGAVSPVITDNGGGGQTVYGPGTILSVPSNGAVISNPGTAVSSGDSGVVTIGPGPG